MQWATLIVRSLVYFLLSADPADSSSIHVNYPGLTTNVHRYFGTSSVFVVHSEPESMRDFDRVKGLLCQLSARSVLAVTIAFGRFHEQMIFYSNRIRRTLIVVSLGSREAVAEFSNITNHLEMSSLCWLLIFDDGVYLEDYLPQSQKNMFNLRFDTEMLVARTNRSAIQEWYWLRNKVNMEDLAVWDFEAGFTLRTDKSLYGRRSSLENSLITATALTGSPVVGSGNYTLDGLCDVILATLSEAANFSVKVVVPREKLYGSWNSEEKRWTGMMVELVTGYASIAVAEYVITPSWMEAIDFSVPFATFTDKLYIKRPENEISWSAYWKTFTPGIWIIILILILLSTVLLTLISTFGRSRINPHVVFGYLILVLGIYCQQGLPVFPTDTPSQIAYFSLLMSAVIVLAAYSAALISFLTVTKLPFSNCEEFIEDGTYKLIVARDSADYEMFKTSEDPLMIKMLSMMNEWTTLPVSMKEGFTQICRQRVAFFSPPYLDMLKLTPSCEVIEIDTRHIRSFAMPLVKDNHFKGLFNHHLLRLHDSGILNVLKRSFQVGLNPATSVHSEVTVWGVMPLLAILAGGILLSVLILSLERTVCIRESRSGPIRNEVRHSKAAKIIDENILNIRFQHRTRYATRFSNFLS